MPQYYNTLTKQMDTLKPLRAGVVGIYSCGPTVYGPQHIGNLRSAVIWDVLRRSLEFQGYTVHHVINVTDFGHLVSDADDGEDKMAKGLRTEGLPWTLGGMKQLAQKYTDKYLADRHALHALRPYRLPFASDHIQEQIDLIRILEAKGFTYTTSDGVYFSTEKDPGYGRLHVCHHDQENESRIGISSEKKHPFDFALWKFNDELGWMSPWGQGFPGWHIECSAMSMKYLGDTFDIHTGGIEHIDIHHENEIAQSQNATGKPLAHIWMHNDHLLMNNEKVAKSSGNNAYLDDVIERGYDPLALRYLFLQAHYRSSQNFTWESLGASATALKRLRAHAHQLREHMSWFDTFFAQKNQSYTKRFTDAIADDLDTPKALALIWEMLKDDTLSPAQKFKTLMHCDHVLGLDLGRIEKSSVPHTAAQDPRVAELLNERARARTDKDWVTSDRIRDELKEMGLMVHDTDAGQTISPL
ncbi:MAG: cysteine--tRNA ligase [Candidatus Pacebacteria bacterium]|nr:cysteine--tRNA ligase [Candidatus Paceibacterota bacterium]MCD8507954.1 cysteine--tRNA ligase [Candidatus Paceibacterota bacterium]MCD8527981.1 cysteine--tRNA ligase [Candidatus Paceibacterota bacterium]MCD8563639.1 cysteine--tRNA ligase [Candidatus Paceibacterota bacterium]